jgi:hypothetical protein
LSRTLQGADRPSISAPEFRGLKGADLTIPLPTAY